LSNVNVECPFVFVAIEGQTRENNVRQVLCIDFWNPNLRLQGLVIVVVRRRGNPVDLWIDSLMKGNELLAHK
jgi:hypothetical protein